MVSITSLEYSVRAPTWVTRCALRQNPSLEVMWTEMENFEKQVLKQGR